MNMCNATHVHVYLYCSMPHEDKLNTELTHPLAPYCSTFL